ncbi:MAG: hypothetical protein AAGI34_07150 [Pseudomonadota bacterium]
MHYKSTNAGALLAGRFGAVETDVTAGGAGDATAVSGAYVDRQGLYSLKALMPFSATLAEGETLSISATFQTATDGAGAGSADLSLSLPATVVATGPSGGGTVTGVAEADVSLAEADAFVRATFTPDLSAANTDTANIGLVYVLGGADFDPISGSAI